MPERISPGEIARGKGDGYLVRLTRTIAGYGRPAYIRLMGEMNNCDNAYASHSLQRRAARPRPLARDVQEGVEARVPDHARRRRGGGEREARRPRPAGGPERRPPHPRDRVAFVWAPMVGGSPNIAALAPGRFWPGTRWVDWVGTSFYSRFPNWTGLDTFYSDLGGGQAQAVRVRGVGDVGRRHALLRGAAVRLDRVPRADEDGPVQPGPALAGHVPAGELPRVGARDQAAPRREAVPRRRRPERRGSPPAPSAHPAPRSPSGAAPHPPAPRRDRR